MWQKNYQYDSVEDAIRGLRAVAAEIGSREYFDGLFVIFAGGICQKEVKKLTDAMDEVFPEIKRAGMSEFYNGGDTGEKRIKLNLTLSDTSRFSVFQFPCEPGGEREAAWQFRQRMEEISDIKCIGLFPSGMALNITEFLESATEGREEVPVFGAMAAVIPQLPGEEAEDMERYCIGESVADAYDAMTSNRSYREVMPQEKVRAEIEKGKGTQFDPVFADIMLSMIDEDREYRMREKRDSD